VVYLASAALSVSDIFRNRVTLDEATGLYHTSPNTVYLSSLVPQFLVLTRSGVRIVAVCFIAVMNVLIVRKLNSLKNDRKKMSVVGKEDK